MKKYLLFFCLVCSQTGFGQKTKFYAGLNFSPGASYRLWQLQNDDGFMSIGKDIVEGLNKSEIPDFGFELGLNGGYQIKDWVAVETGIQYSRKGFQTKWEDYYFPYQSPVSKASQVSVKLKQTFHFVDIPLKVFFTPGKGKLRFCGTVGADLNFFIVNVNHTSFKGNTSAYSLSDFTKKTTKGFNTFNFSPLLGVGLIYSPTQRIGVKVEPMARFQALSFIGKTITLRLWDVGINLSLIYRI